MPGSARSMIRRAFGSPTLSVAGRLRVGYTGALVSAPAACPQWCVIGPAFHVLHSVLPTPSALLGTATLETFITFGSQTRNAQMAYNVQAPTASVPLSNIVRPWGPGAPFFVLRNFCGMAGIRWLSPPIQRALEPAVPSGPRELLSDMAASVTGVTMYVDNGMHAMGMVQAKAVDQVTMMVAVEQVED